MRVSDSHISPSCVAARRARRAGAGHLMLLSPEPSVRGHDHRPQHPTTSHHLRSGDHGATLTSPPFALEGSLTVLTVPCFGFCFVNIHVSLSPFQLLVSTSNNHTLPVYLYRDNHYNITFVTKYFSNVEIFLSCKNISTAPECCVPAPGQPETGLRCADQGTTGSVAPPRHCSHSPYLAHCRMSPPGILQEYWDIQTRMYLIIVSVSVADKLKRSQI